MSCERARALLHRRLDGETTPEEDAAFDGHLAACPSCRRTWDEQRAIRDAVRVQADRFAAPTLVRARILADLAAATAPAAVRPRAPGWAWFGGGAALAASLMLALNLTVMSGAEEGGGVVDQVISAHVRSLQADHLTDVASSDRHTVKPWFNGRLDLAPPVRDFAEAGFPLVGGRLDALERRPVAALVYRRRQHVINLFIGPAAPGGDRPPATAALRGYTLIRWSSGGLGFWLISDVDGADLAVLARLLRAP